MEFKGVKKSNYVVKKFVTLAFYMPESKVLLS